jgi:hypothetical protein
MVSLLLGERRISRDGSVTACWRTEECSCQHSSADGYSRRDVVSTSSPIWASDVAGTAGFGFPKCLCIRIPGRYPRDPSKSARPVLVPVPATATDAAVLGLTQCASRKRKEIHHISQISSSVFLSQSQFCRPNIRLTGCKFACALLTRIRWDTTADNGSCQQSRPQKCFPNFTGRYAVWERLVPSGV